MRWFLLLCLLWLSVPCKAQVEKGKASFYSDKWKGRRTASGEKYQPDSLTCAHRTHPFNTLLKVTCVAKGTSIIVRVNDRGPFIRGRVVDLSGSAARKLDMYLMGVAEVEVEVYVPPVMGPPPYVAVPDSLNDRPILVHAGSHHGRRTYPLPERMLGVFTTPSGNEKHRRK
jgi:rare lipoprotein A (peptidoglycan hydrolase)